MSLDPVPMLHTFIAGDAGWPGNCARSDGSADFGHRTIASMSPSLQILAIFCSANSSTARGPRSLTRGESGSSPCAFMQDFMSFGMGRMPHVTGFRT